MRINPARLLGRLDDLARIGAIAGGGVCRLAFSEEDKAGRDYVQTEMHSLGLTTYIDGIGNLVGVRPGRREGPVVMTGSHTDTVASGGRFDGSLGVLAGLETVEVLNDAGVTTEYPLAVVSFVNEEGVRYMPDMMGSLFLSGRLSIEEARAIEGTDGTTIGDNMDRLGYAGNDDLSGLKLRAFVELHIEQGPWLEMEGTTIGVVEAVQGISWSEFRIQGAANHAGATPMSMRHDAGYVVGALAHFVRRLASEKGTDLRATVGSIVLSPNLINVIPGEAVVTVDLRNPDSERLHAAEKQVEEHLMLLAEAEGVQVAHRRLAKVEPVALNHECVRCVEEAARALGYSCRSMTSGASHDAQILATRFPSAMIFVPSVGGVSHSVEEYTRPEDVEAGANVLLHTIAKLAG